MVSSFLSIDNLSVNQKVELELLEHESTFLEAITAYVHHIAATMPAPYTLFVSGGIDSQAMLYAWHLSGIPFKAINVTYNGFNAHDFDEMATFSSALGIKVEQISFDIINFLEHELNDYAMKYKCSSPQLCTHMAFSELIKEGTKIFSGNTPVINQPSMNNTIFGLQRYATLTKANMVPFFLLSDKRSAEIAAYEANKLKDQPLESYEFKCTVYRNLGIPIVPQAGKLTGFELLKKYYAKFDFRVTSAMKLRHSSLGSQEVFDQLFRNKYMIVLKNHYQTQFVEKAA